jgi:penicillin V acylase-like amidase (Ntn superfamily)
MKKITDEMTYHFSISDKSTDRMKHKRFFLGMLCPSVNPSIKVLLTNSPIYINHQREFFRWIIFFCDHVGKFCANGL